MNKLTNFFTKSLLVAGICFASVSILTACGVDNQSSEVDGRRPYKNPISKKKLEEEKKQVEKEEDCEKYLKGPAKNSGEGVNKVEGLDDYRRCINS